VLARLHFHQRLGGGKIHFQVFLGHWQNHLHLAVESMLAYFLKACRRISKLRESLWFLFDLVRSTQDNPSLCLTQNKLIWDTSPIYNIFSFFLYFIGWNKLQIPTHYWHVTDYLAMFPLHCLCQQLVEYP
jgi:hypothetical protein